MGSHPFILNELVLCPIAVHSMRHFIVFLLGQLSLTDDWPYKEGASVNTAWQIATLGKKNRAAADTSIKIGFTLVKVINQYIHN